MAGRPAIRFDDRRELRPAAGRRIAVGVATRGRPGLVRLVVERLRRQTLRPAHILVAFVEPDDVVGLTEAADLALLRCAPGLTRQRNAILDRLPPEAEIVAFFDDDFVPHADWLKRAVACLDARADVVALTGDVIANGVSSGEIAPPQALDLIARAGLDGRDWVEDGVSPYGCNMAFRRAAVGGLRFDEQLPLYGWLEDRDFAARVTARGGRQVRIGAALGVHLGVGAGRMSDRRLGYAQIANPLHLLGRRTMSGADFARRVLTDLASNLCKAPGSPARRRRLAGNAIALAEALAGRCRPERALRL